MSLNLILDPRHLTDRDTFESMVEALARTPLAEHARARQDAKRALDAALPPDAQPALLTYADALTDGAAVHEEAAVKVGLLLGLGVGVALNAWPDEAPDELARVASDVVSGVLSAGVSPDIAQDVARRVLRALARVTGEAAGI